ncbi:MAG: DUF4344 domain-containing metallopeptidase [Pseudomonadales bacterium]|nr:DUF4344 domain-containing metallopeptidase [Pseudomonadales bacterium]
MDIKKILIAIICNLSVVAAVQAGPAMTVSFVKTDTSTLVSKETKANTIETVNNVVSFFNEIFYLEQPIELLVGADDGPLYNGEGQIQLPYSFIQKIEDRFSAAQYQESGVSVAEAVADSLMHTLIHEFAHAVIHSNSIPVLGREEDAADSLASVLLIDFFAGGQEIVISAADLFDLESADSDVISEEDYWDEHSLDSQRYYAAMCHVYGSDPEGYADIPEQLELSAERAELCIEEYSALSRSWQQLLQPILKAQFK